MTPESDSPSDRYARQSLFEGIGTSGQRRLREAQVLVVGAGALGSHAAEHLTRAGVGALRIVDRDLVEWTNLHRQIGFTEEDARRHEPKATALARHLRRVNSDVEVEAIPTEFEHSRALSLAEGCDLLLDGTDNLPSRFLLNDVSYHLSVPWIYAGAVGASSHVQFFSGRTGPCLRCQLPDLPPPGTLATCDTAGVIAPAASVAAGWQVAWTLRYLSERDVETLSRRQAIFSLWEPAARLVEVEANPDCPVCVHHRFEALAGLERERATVLCGRRAVQVQPAGARTLDLLEVTPRLEPLGRLQRFDGALRVHSAEGFVLTLFADGRAIFDGLTDPQRARSLYARFIGQ